MLHIVAHSATGTNLSLLATCHTLNVEAALVPPEKAQRVAQPGDLALARLDVVPTLGGVEPGFWELRQLERRHVCVLNPPRALYASHDKLATAVRLEQAGLPHPRTAHVDETSPLPDIEFPLVVKPRFGSWGRDVLLCHDAKELERSLRRLQRRAWFRRQGVLVQELVPPCGYDVRVIVAGGTVVGAIERVAAPSEWRTNIALGGARRSTNPPPEVRALAVAAATAVEGDLVGIDLLPTPPSGYTILELNAAVDFTKDYTLHGIDPFEEALRALLAVPDSSRQDGSRFDHLPRERPVSPTTEAA